MNPQEAVQALSARGLSQAQIAVMAGTAQSAIHRIAHGGVTNWELGNLLITLAKSRRKSTPARPFTGVMG